MPFGWFSTFIPRDRQADAIGGKRGKGKRRAASKRANASRRRNR